MTPEDIRKMAVALAKDWIEFSNLPAGLSNEVLSGVAKEMARIVRSVLRTHCIVSKEKATELCRLTLEHGDSIDYGLIDGLTDIVCDIFREQYHAEAEKPISTPTPLTKLINDGRMKAKRKSDGKVIEVTPVIFGYSSDNAHYHPYELDFKVEEAEEVTLDGWVAIDEAYDACFLHTSKPHQESQEIADTGDYNTVWESDGKTYLLDNGFFPDMDSESDPLEVTITIKPKKK